MNHYFSVGCEVMRETAI